MESSSHGSPLLRLSRRLRHSRKLMARALLTLVRRARLVCRTLGLQVIPALCTREESPKVVWSHSRPRALTRCLIHIIPSAVSIVIILLNQQGYFIGEDLEGFRGDDGIKLGLIQLAAKLHELMIVSSIGSIIFHFIRSELLFGNGLPLGLVTSGWSFSQLSYLWSAEFIGGTRSVSTVSGLAKWRGIALVMLVLTGSILTVLAGPISAILMVPVRSEWFAGGGIAWMNGSDTQLWPSELDSDYFSDLNCTMPYNQFDGTDPCPSVGLFPLHHVLSTGGWPVHDQIDFELRERGSVRVFHSRSSDLPYMNPWVYTAHHATASMQDALRNLHYRAMLWLNSRMPTQRPFPLHLTWAESATMEVETRAPAVRVHCNETTHSFSSDPLGRLTVKFPRLEEGTSNSWRRKPPEGLDTELDSEPGADHYFVTDEFDLTEYLPRYLLDRGLTTTATLPLNETELFDQDRRIIVIPKDIWNDTASSLGLVILMAGDDVPSEAVHFNALACSVDARWVNATSVMKLLPEKQPEHDYGRGGSRVPVSVELPGGETGVLGGIGLITTDLPHGSWSSIRLHESWYNLFSPPVPDDIFPTRDMLAGPRLKQTSLEKLLDLVYVNGDFSHTGPERQKISAVLAALFVDGVARTGLHLNRQTSQITRVSIFGDKELFDFTEDQARSLVRQGGPRETFSRPIDFNGHGVTEVRMTVSYMGYNMSTSNGWFTLVSMALLSIHAAIVLAHCGLALWKGDSGSPWDTIVELLALAHGSTPPGKEILANTSSGVQSFQTFKLVAWIENSGEAPEGEDRGEGRLQLMLSGQPAVRDPASKPEIDKLYN